MVSGRGVGTGTEKLVELVRGVEKNVGVVKAESSQTKEFWLEPTNTLADAP